MQLLLRSYLAVSKEIQHFELFLVVILCYINLVSLEEVNYENCPQVTLTCVNKQKDVWYSPSLFAEVCATNITSCRKFASPCEHEKSKCRGEKWKPTMIKLCNKLDVGSTGECNCPLVENCNNNLYVCARRSTTCKLYKNECEFRQEQCIFNEWEKTNPFYCCDFLDGQKGLCGFEKSRSLCASQNNKICRTFRTKCEMNEENRYIAEDNHWQERHSRFCKCLQNNLPGACNCGRALDID